MRKKNTIGIPVGTSFLIVVMVLITIIAFSTISFVSATRDYQLSEEVAITTQEFYKADTVAQKEMELIDKILHILYEDSSSQEEYFQRVADYPWRYNVMQDESTYISYKVKVNDKEQLLCKVKVLYPENKDAFEIITWKLEYEQEWKGNSTFPILIE